MSDAQPTGTSTKSRGLDVREARRDFPILNREIHGHPLVYLDNANTSQKPQGTIDTITHYYRDLNANIHRGVYELSLHTTRVYEEVRGKVRAFIGAADEREIVFVRGTTEGINLVAQTYGRTHIGAGDEIIVTTMEHHSNIVPWQMLCEQVGATLRVAPITVEGDVILDEYRSLFNKRTKFAAISHVSNAIGTVNPAKEMIAIAHEHSVPVLLDGAQSVPHFPVDVQDLDADFYVFSGHKMYAPTGIGVVYGKLNLLEEMPPFLGGGDMILTVSFEKSTWAPVPQKFEAGTPNVAGVFGLGATLDYLNGLGMSQIQEYEDGVVSYAVERLSTLDDITIIGTPRQRTGVISFTIKGVHPHDAGTILDRDGIAIRAGHHCSQPLMEFYGVPATNRVSFGLYNNHNDVDRLVAGLETVIEVFR